MSEDFTKFKIDLLEEQIENIERSGYFTEKEIDKYSSFFHAELDTLKHTLTFKNCVDDVAQTTDRFEKAKESFEKLKKINPCDIDVIDPKTLNQNDKEAFL